MEILQQAPRFGPTGNFNIGFVGWTRTPGLLSDIIGFEERREVGGRPQVTHAFIVSGIDEVIESHFDTGVARAPLSKYLDDPKTEVYFRQPAGWTLDLGLRLAETAAKKVGARYSTELVLLAGLSDTLLGHLVNGMFGGWPDRELNHLAYRQGTFFCSQLVCWSMGQQPEYVGKSILTTPLDAVDPQLLLADPILFQPGITRCLKASL